jgi:hypothetical protein
MDGIGLMTREEVIASIDNLIKDTKLDLGLEWGELGKAIAEDILNIINKPVQPGTMRWFLGEDKDNRMYDFPRPLKAQKEQNEDRRYRPRLP